MILSIDPGTQKTGWAVFSDKLLLSGTLHQKNEDATLRSIAITESLFDLVKRREYKITDLVIEDQYVRKNAKSALVLSRLVGMLQYTFFTKFRCDIHLVAPTIVYSVLPFTAQEAKKQYHRMVLEFISEKYAPVQSTDEAFAILLGLAFMKKRGD